METAESIAEAINASVDACIAERIPIDQCVAETQALWNKARELALQDEVARILRDESLAEMDKATPAQGRHLRY